MSNGALIVAGGVRYPDGAIRDDEAKAWDATIYVLPAGASTWQIAGRLPTAAGYGASLSSPDGVVFIGGGDDVRGFSAVHLLRWTGTGLMLTDLPSLPRPLVMMAAAIDGHTIYVAGGLDRPGAAEAQHVFLTLDLEAQSAGWRELPPWPGPARFRATAAVQGGAFYLIGGAQFVPDPNGQPQRKPLSDGWKYRPDGGWSPIAELPQPMMGAPSPAPSLGPSHILMLGGGDVGSSHQASQGFSRNVWAYHTITDTWVQRGDLPFSLASTTVVPDGEGWILSGGETLSGVPANEIWSSRPVPRQTKLGWLNYAALTGYLIAIVGLGVWFGRRQKTTKDYFTASGRIPWWAVGLSIYATMLSSITFMAIPAKAYATDWTFALANLSLLLLAPFVIRYYLPFFRNLRVTSAYEYLERRFSLPVRLYASLAFIFFHCGRMAIVIYLPSIALAAACGLEVNTCILLIGTLCVVYTAFGGIEAVVWTDAIQSIVLLGAAVLSLVLIVGHVDGGWSGLWSEAAAHDKLRWFDLRWDASAATLWVILIGSIFGNLGPYTADQSVVQRYITTRDSHQAARAIWTNAWLVLPSTILFFAIGTGLFVFYKQHPLLLEPTLSTDAIFPVFIADFMPPGVAGLVIAGVFAAAQSTVSSSLNSIVTAVVTDFLRRFRPDLSDRFCLRVARILSVAIGALGITLALLLAATDIGSLWDAYLSLLGILASGLAALFALGIFSRRTNGTGALIGALGAAALLWWVQHNTPLHFLLLGPVGFAACVSIGWLASRFSPPPSTEKLAGLTWSSRQF